ncbi:MAG: ABC transporter ATP-binding protein/permease [Rhodospirillales bacterium]|nr:ABC transporter ATP-binding protein/permease [Rhodospirillales bacterium]MDH3918451.1 ABC transporter ATP-binding protein/permease [Rhodospirillales bacterium]MDH3967454.1 ABC transporter ATP-binding protein/permease [Rhodospirillales bacterium]
MAGKLTDPAEEPSRRAADPQASALGWLFGFVRPHAGRLAAIVLLSLASTGLALAQPYITKFLIDDGLLAGQMALVVWLCLAMVTAGLAGSLLAALNRWHYVSVSGRILFALREAVYRHLQRLSPAYYARSRGGDLMNRLDGDVGEIQRFAVDTLLASVNGVIALAGALALMASLSWQLSLLALVLLPAEVLFLRAMRPRVEAMTRRVRERSGDLTSFLFDTLGTMKFIQSVAAEDREARRLEGLNRSYLKDLLRLQMVNFATAAVPNLMTSLSTALVFIAGGTMMIQGRLTLGALIAFSAYLARATGPVQTLLGLYVASLRARVSLTRVMEVTRVAPAVAQPARPRPLPAGGAGEVRFEGLSFGYDPEGPPVLEDVDLIARGGGKIGLIGISGAGKTTLIDLLHRHYDPAAGRILLDGLDLRDLDLSELRRKIAVVAQDTVLFAGSVADNIRYAAPEASDAALREAAVRAQVDRFVLALPQGYDTEVGARGTALSGGQRQRLAIARALLQDPLVLVLDEATSAVDYETEARIVQAIDELFPDRTRLVISHRPEALQGADAILELARGRLVPAARPAGVPQ